MSATHYHERLNGDRASPRRRAISFALAIGIELLLLLAFLGLDFRPEKRPEFKGGSIATFDLAADEEADASKAVQPARVIRKITHPVLPPVKPTITPRPLQMLEVSKEFLESSDIAKLGSNAPDAGERLAEGRQPGDSARVGTGPNGEPLYAAEWYREPTNQELATYLPKTMPEGGGWGLIACRTIERFRVADCVELGNSPPGSHLANAARQAAWQFIVRPPRVGGKVMVGQWVRIRIVYGVGSSENDSE